MSVKKLDISEYLDDAEIQEIRKEYPDVGDKPEVIIKRIGFGQQNDILDSVSNVTVKGKNIEVSPQYGKLRTLTIQKCIVNAPFPNTLEYIQNEMSAPLGEFLFEEIDAFNTLPKEKKG